MVRVKWVVALVAIGILAAAALLPAAEARSFRGELTAPSGGAPFGGDIVGEYRISVRGSQVTISAWVELDPPAGYVFEGWLVDMQTGYKLSLGALSHGDDDDDDDEGRMVLEFHQRMVNVWTYGVLVITTEPSRDLDPNPATPAAGALLPAPFGQ
jgi:hypothetical protein